MTKPKMQLQIFKEIFSSTNKNEILDTALLAAKDLPITYFDMKSGKFILLIDTGILMQKTVPVQKSKTANLCDTCPEDPEDYDNCEKKQFMNQCPWWKQRLKHQMKQNSQEIK